MNGALGPVEEVIHGVLVRDPHRWLEDRNLPETEQWIQEQQHRCETYFALCPGVAMLEGRVRAYLDGEVVDQPAHVANCYFYRKRRKGEEQASICAWDSITAEERVLVNPSGAGIFTSVGIHRISEDGKLLAFDIKSGGEDRIEIHVVEVESGRIIRDSVPRGYARGFAFAPQGDGYLYSQETPSDSGAHAIRLHRFGEKDDEVVFHVPRTVGSRLVLIANGMRLGAVWLRPQGSESLVDFWIASGGEARNWSRVFEKKQIPYIPILCHGGILALVETESKNPQLIELSTSGEELRTLIPATEVPIRQFAIIRDRIYVSYLDRGVVKMDAWNISGQKLPSIKLPHDGTVQIIPGYTERTQGFFYSYETFDTPPAIYEYDSRTDTSRLWHRRGPVRAGHRATIRKETVSSTDLVVVPLTLVAESGKSWDQPAHVIMTSYGGFGVAMTPQFSVLVAIMMELGVTFAMPHIRGGGEHGRAWHEAARGKSRQSAIDDFIAAADWLCDQGITTPSQLGIFGGSNSGLLVGAAMTQRPDLFGAVLSIAPLLDMVRYEAFDQAVKWRREYGTVEDPEEFRALYAFSPYHRVKEDVNYPATMFVSGDKDDRCNPGHVRKMVALLEQRTAQTLPVIMDYNEQRGHSPALPLSFRIAALTRRLAFLCRELHIPLPEGEFDEAPCN
jgi:prolyl oligopeptidase